jgi:hypothetical protein
MLSEYSALIAAETLKKETRLGPKYILVLNLCQRAKGSGKGGEGISDKTLQIKEAACTGSLFGYQ